MFYVVHVDTWFQTVPELWVDKANKIIRWPRAKQTTISTWIKKQVPSQSDWAPFNYVCLFGPFETYEDSKQFEQQCTGYSSQDEKLYEQYKNKESSKKRSRKRNPKYETDNDLSTESEDDNPPKKKSTYATKLQPLPSASDFVPFDNIRSLAEIPTNITVSRSEALSTTFNSVIDKNNSELTSVITEQNCYRNYPTHQDDPLEWEIQTGSFSEPTHINSPILIQVDNKGYLSMTDHTFHKNDENDINIPNTSKDISEKVVKSTPQIIKNLNRKKLDTRCTNCCPCIEKINRKVDILLHILQSKNEDGRKKEETLELLQLQTKEELNEFEKSLLEDTKKREQFKNVIIQEGGKDVGDHIRRAMKKLMANNLALQYSWTGQRNTIRFKDYLISKLILNSVASVHTSINKKTMEDAIQSWLNHASDRKKKLEKKEDHRELLINILISSFIQR